MVAVTHLWSGAVTDDAVTVVAKLDTAAVSCRLSIGGGFSAAVDSDAQGYVKLTKSGLDPATQYPYSIERAGVTDAMTGTVKTFPTEGVAAGFTFTAASCFDTGSTHKVFDAIRSHSPVFHAGIGDQGYPDISTNNPALYRAVYESNLASATIGPLARAVPFTHCWDDHDYGTDNSDGTSASKTAAASAYRQCVPHYPLLDAGGIWQSFVVGKVWFVQTDLRYYRSANSATDDASKTMMGATQKQWFKDTLLAAKAAGAVRIFWLNSQTWRVKTPYAGFDAGDADHWGSFSTERTELADFFKANTLHPLLVVIHGDAHMLAADPYGYASDFATGGGAPIPQYCVAALDKTGLKRGTNWPIEPVTGSGQYGLFTVAADGSLGFQGISVNNTTGVETVLMSHTEAPKKRLLIGTDGKGHPVGSATRNYVTTVR